MRLPLQCQQVAEVAGLKKLVESQSCSAADGKRSQAYMTKGLSVRTLWQLARLPSSALKLAVGQPLEVAAKERHGRLRAFLNKSCFHCTLMSSVQMGAIAWRQSLAAVAHKTRLSAGCGYRHALFQLAIGYLASEENSLRPYHTVCRAMAEATQMTHSDDDVSSMPSAS
jgi:hypothetical protein